MECRDLPAFPIVTDPHDPPRSSLPGEGWAGGESLLSVFLAESIEQLAEVDRELAALEQGSGDAEALTRLFRTLHTLKGTCGFFGLAELEAVARKGADPLRRLIDEQAPLDAATTLALSTVAAEARRILECLARRGFVDSSVRAHGSKQ